MHFKEAYRQYNEAITPDPALVRETADLAREQEEEGRKDRREVAFRLIRGTVAVAAVCLCFIIVVPVLAASEPIYRLMSLVSPELAQFFRPVQEADEDKGIRMEVVSAYIHDDTAQVYVTLQDLEGDRIDGTIDLYDSYFLQTPFDCSATCKTLGYDQETRTATLLITIWQRGDQKITGDKVTFAMRGFISHKKEYKGVEIPVSLLEAEEDAPASAQHINGRGGGRFQGEDGTAVPKKAEVTYDVQESGNPTPIVRVLVPGEMIPGFPVEGIGLTGMGYVDGLLHIQLAVPDRIRNDNHGSLYLMDKEGNIRGDDECIYFHLSEREGNGSSAGSGQERVDYMDYIFSVPREELKRYTLYGDFVTSGVQVEGKWSVTIPLEE